MRLSTDLLIYTIASNFQLQFASQFLKNADKSSRRNCWTQHNALHILGSNQETILAQTPLRTWMVPSRVSRLWGGLKRFLIVFRTFRVRF